MLRIRALHLPNLSADDRHLKFFAASRILASRSAFAATLTGAQSKNFVPRS
jgi:hypothetical protein